MMTFNHSCIIDDDPISVFGMKRSMKKVNFAKTIEVYHNGQEAIDGITSMIAAGQKLPSVIFLDLNMPIMDGWEFLEYFTKIPNTNTDYVTIFIVSSSVNPRDIIRAKEYSIVNNYILKPIQPKDLIKVLSEIKAQ